MVRLGRSLSNLSSELEGALRVLGEVLERPIRAESGLPSGYKERTNLSAESVDELVSRYKAGTDMTRLAREFGIHRMTVRRLLDERGVAVRDTQVRMTERQMTEMAELYEQGWSLYRLGKKYGCDGHTVGRKLKGMGARVIANMQVDSSPDRQ